jgi:hypothetical protein
VDDFIETKGLPMNSRISALVAVPVLVVLTAWSAAQDPPKLKNIELTHAFDLGARKFGEADITPTTQRFGVEAVRDLNTGKGLYVTEKGSVALCPGFDSLKAGGNAKGAVWITGLDLPARKAGEKEFQKTTKVHSLEIFRDPNSDAFLYITETGIIAACPAGGRPSFGNKAPVWDHSIDLNVRKGGEKDWKTAAKIGIEIYRDPNTGNLIYVTDTGAIAVIAETAESKDKEKAPSWLHGLDLAVRRADEPQFTKETKRYGVEVFRDESNGNLVFICENGSLAVTPGGEKLAAPTVNPKEPTWSHGWNVKARKYQEKEFTDRTKVFGGEVFRDENTGVLLTVSEVGSLSVLPTK